VTTRRHRAPERVWTPSFVLWCVAMMAVSAAAGVTLVLALSGT